jgi:hypothetical protein
MSSDWPIRWSALPRDYYPSLRRSTVPNKNLEDIFGWTTVKHSWYKHFYEMESPFYLFPDFETGSWEIARTLEPKHKNTIVGQNPVMLSAFLYGECGGFDHTVGNLGNKLFTWLRERGYEMEAKHIELLSRDNSAEKDRRYKFLYNGDSRRNDPILDELFVKEYYRMLADVKNTHKKIKSGLIQKFHKNVGYLFPEGMTLDIVSIILDHILV